MTPADHPPVDPGLPGLLRQLLQQHAAGDEPGLAASIASDPHRLRDAWTIVGALCLGGAAFAARIVSLSQPGLGDEDCQATVLNAFSDVIEPPPGAPVDHEAQIAQALIDRFDLPTAAPSLLDLVRAEFLITAGPPDQVPEAALAAMRHGAWELALRGFDRLRQALQAQTPRQVMGLGAVCLHKLGRFAEADRWAAQGLGDQLSLLTIGPVHTQAELLQRWSGRRSPVVTILCTTYNHERYIDNTIRGFLSQDCSFPFEILIHDDASTDGTQAVIRHWQAQYPDLIRPLLQTRNQHSRGVRPFELLLARARGEFVATCEGDDFWVDPGKLQRQVGFLQANPGFSCSAHNYYHFVEKDLTVRPWTAVRPDHVMSPRQLMGLARLLWLPTLVFRKTFNKLPPERDLSPTGDFFLTSYLGTQGSCMFFESVLGSVRRENEFSLWSPLPTRDKEVFRVKAWAALVRLHVRLGNRQAVSDLIAKISATSLDDETKANLLEAACGPQPSNLATA